MKTIWKWSGVVVICAWLAKPEQQGRRAASRHGLALLIFVLIAFTVEGADVAISGLTETTSPGPDTVLEVADPDATPKSRKITLPNLRGAMGVPPFDSADPGAASIFPYWDDAGGEIDWATVAALRTLLGLGTADEVVFGTVTANAFLGSGDTAESRMDVPNDDGSQFFGFQAANAASESINVIAPGANGTGFWLGTGSGTNHTLSLVAGTGSGSVVRASGATFTTLPVPTANDPDVSTEGHISYDANGDVLRGYDGANQVALGRKTVAIHVTVITPQDLADAQRDAFLFWSNESGMSFVVTGWAGWSGTDDTTLNIEEADADGVSNNATVDAVELATGSGPYTGTDTTITGPTIETGHVLLLDFDDADAPTYVKMTIYGYFNADVN